MEIKSYKYIEETPVRLDVYSAEKTGLTRSHIKKLCDTDDIKVNGISQKASKMLKNGDEIEIRVPDPEPTWTQPENLPLDIVYQDESIAVINKAQGVTVHAGNGNKDGTLVNALLYHLDSLSGINGVIRPGIVHRIDKDTSGLLVVAKNDKAHVSLSKQLLNKTLGRTYIALLEGILKTDEGRIETYISRDERHRTRMAVSNYGRKAVTNYRVLDRLKNYTLCEFNLETGRTHQIRVHAKYLGHPIVGDAVYGYKNQKFDLNGQLLHAARLRLVHPETGKSMEFSAPLPDYFEKILNILKNH